MSEHETFSDDAAPFLLGALDPAEQAAFERHMAGCSDCRAEVDQLRMAADALPRSVEPFLAPPSLKRSLMAAVREQAPEHAEPRRRPLLERVDLRRLISGMRPEVAWVSAAFVLAVGIALGVAAGELSSSGDESHRVISAVVDRTRVADASATLVVPKNGPGPAQLQVTGLPAPKDGEVYEIWLKRGDQAQPGPLFAVDTHGDGVAAVPNDLEGVSTVLVTREKTGGAQKPSEVPIISAKI